MKKTYGILAAALLLLSCQNKSRQEHSSTLIETKSEETYQRPDTAVTEEGKNQQEDVKGASTPASSASSSSHESNGQINRSATQGDAFFASKASQAPSGHSKNMRGFDPASEDDMEDNGMSRYMENNDDEGWD